MSLINQMLKDLEERGAISPDADVQIVNNLSAANAANAYPMLDNNAKLSLIKMGSMMMLLAGAAYLWTQNTQAESRIETRQKISSKVLNQAPDELLKQASSPVTNNTDVEAVEISEMPLQTAEVNSTSNLPTYQGPPLFETELKFNIAHLQNDIAKPLPKQTIALAKNEFAMGAESVKKKYEDQALHQTPTKSKKQEKSIQLAHIEKPANKPNIDSSQIGKQIRPDQQSANVYKQALTFLQQGRIAEAQAMLVSALEASPNNHEARQTLAGLLLDNKRHDEAKTILSAGVSIAPEQSDFRMALARLQVETGDVSSALISLEQGLAYAKNNGNYQIFLATLLQRISRHNEAIAHYNAALALNSASSDATTSALVGLGISLQAMDKLSESQEAFTRAQSSTSLSPDLLAFVEQRIKQIQQRLQN